VCSSDLQPSLALLAEMEIEPPDTLFGLYQGTPLTERGWGFGNTLPDRITIYQKPIEDVSETEEDVVTEIGETLIHEVGHYFGLSEEEIQDIEDRYWERRNRRLGLLGPRDDDPDSGPDGDEDDEHGEEDR
jgi:predicted Zn-dependent protease with MMP-like domain